MRKFIGLMIVGLAAMAAAMADEIQLPHITVYGTATTEVTPNQMVWSVNVRNRGPALEVVADEHTKIVQTVLRFLHESKVDEKTIQTSRMEFGENWEYKSDSRVKEGYFASTDISFKVRDLEAYRGLWSGLSKIACLSVQNVAYDHTDRISHQNDARLKAVLAAKAKATDLAKALGSEIGEPLLVEEDLSVNDWWRGNAVVNNLRVASAEQAEPSEMLAPGTIPIKMRVRVAFRLVTAGKQ